MESDCELKPKLSLEPDQEKPAKKKGLWQKIKEFFTQEPEGEGSEKLRNRDPGSW